MSARLPSALASCTETLPGEPVVGAPKRASTVASRSRSPASAGTASTVEAVPANPDQRGVVAAVLERFGEQTTGYGPGSVAVQLSSSNGNLAEIVRALDAEGIVLSQLQIHEPTLDDVFLAKTGRHLEGAGDADESETEQELEPARV